jgi:hypothetical protein
VHLTSGSSPRIISSFLASSFFCSQAESTPAHLQVTHTIAEKFYPMQRFPFGSPLLILTRLHLKDPRVFVLGVYTSAVNARRLNGWFNSECCVRRGQRAAYLLARGRRGGDHCVYPGLRRSKSRLVPLGAQLTLVLFDGEVLSSGGKISKPII